MPRPLLHLFMRPPMPPLIYPINEKPARAVFS